MLQSEFTASFFKVQYRAKLRQTHKCDFWSSWFTSKFRSTFKLLQYCPTHVHLAFVGDTVSLMQQVSKIAHAWPSPFWPQVNDHFSLRSFMRGICMWCVIDWKIDVLLYAKFSIDILKSLLLKRTLTIAHECGAEIASQEWYFQGSSFKKEVRGTFQLDLNVMSNNVEISSQQFFKCVFSNACCFNCLSTKNRHNFTRA